MKTLLPLKVATTGILTILTFLIVFHLLVISRVIPSDMVWGGNLAEKNPLLLMESISIFVNLLLLVFVGAFSKIIRIRMASRVIKAGFWIMFVLFMLNTLGNLLSKNPLEMYLFTPLTLLLTLFCLRIATYRDTEK